MTELKKLLEDIRHELTFLHGLVATDRPDISSIFEPIIIEESELIERIDKLIKESNN